MRLEGIFGNAPPFDLVRGYSRDDFERLMRDGIGPGDRDLVVMTKVVQFRFSVMTDDEINALFEFHQPATIPLEDEHHVEAALS